MTRYARLRSGGRKMRIIRESSDRLWVYWQRRDGALELDVYPKATVVTWTEEDEQPVPKRGWGG